MSFLHLFFKDKNFAVVIKHEIKLFLCSPTEFIFNHIKVLKASRVLDLLNRLIYTLI